METNGNRQILLMIDNHAVRSFISMMLEENQTAFDFCNSWEEAEDKLRHNTYSLFVADHSQALTEPKHSCLIEASDISSAKTLLILNKNEMADLSSTANTCSHMYYQKDIRPKLLWIVINSLINTNSQAEEVRWFHAVQGLTTFQSTLSLKQA